jgi:hypothetical protein
MKKSKVDQFKKGITSQGFDISKNKGSFHKDINGIKLTVRQRLGAWEILISKANSYKGSDYKQLAHGFTTSEKAQAWCGHFNKQLLKGVEL